MHAKQQGLFVAAGWRLFMPLKLMHNTDRIVKLLICIAWIWFHYDCGLSCTVNSICMMYEEIFNV